jgi:hypothetical protein
LHFFPSYDNIGYQVYIVQVIRLSIFFNGLADHTGYQDQQVYIVLNFLLIWSADYQDQQVSRLACVNTVSRWLLVFSLVNLYDLRKIP